MDFSAISTFLTNIFEKFWNFIVGLLPISPVEQILQEMEQLPYLNYINWFVPVGECATVASYWLKAVAAYYLCSIVLRWIKVIQ